MKTVDFVSDVSRVKAWLNSEVERLNHKGIYASFWLHLDVAGFGVVIVDENSGEFHLMPDGSVTRHVEIDGEVVLDEQVGTTDFKLFVDLFNDFKNRVLTKKM